MEVSGNFLAPGYWHQGKKIRWGQEPCEIYGKEKNIFFYQEIELPEVG